MSPASWAARTCSPAPSARHRGHGRARPAQPGRVEFPARDPMPLTGSTIHIFVPRDRVQLTKRTGGDGVDSVNAVNGRVREIEYQGTWVKITLERTGDEDFVVNLPDRDLLADPVDAGDAVRAHWTASDVHLLIVEPGLRPC